MSENQTPTTKVVQGEDILVMIDGKQALHAESHSLKMDLEVKEYRTVHSNGKKKAAGDINWTIDVSGLVVVDPDITDAHVPEEIIALFLSKKEVEVIVKSPIAGFTKLYKGSGLITSLSIEAKAGENSTYSASIGSSGNLVPTTPPVSA